MFMKVFKSCDDGKKKMIVGLMTLSQLRQGADKHIIRFLYWQNKSWGIWSRWRYELTVHRRQGREHNPHPATDQLSKRPLTSIQFFFTRKPSAAFITRRVVCPNCLCVSWDGGEMTCGPPAAVQDNLSHCFTNWSDVCFTASQLRMLHFSPRGLFQPPLLRHCVLEWIIRCYLGLHIKHCV